MTLLDLAERCEEAREPAFEGMFAEAFEAIHGGRSSIGAWSAFCALTEADAWLDAAVMLLPEGWERWSLSNTLRVDGSTRHYAEVGFDGQPCRAATPALALCAAALRTRSTQEGDKG